MNKADYYFFSFLTRQEKYFFKEQELRTVVLVLFATTSGALLATVEKLHQLSFGALILSNMSACLCVFSAGIAVVSGSNILRKYAKNGRRYLLSAELATVMVVAAVIALALLVLLLQVNATTVHIVLFFTLYALLLFQNPVSDRKKKSIVIASLTSFVSFILGWSTTSNDFQFYAFIPATIIVLGVILQNFTLQFLSNECPPNRHDLTSQRYKNRLYCYILLTFILLCTICMFAFTLKLAGILYFIGSTILNAILLVQVILLNKIKSTCINFVHTYIPIHVILLFFLLFLDSNILS